MVGTGRFELPNALVLANERPLARVFCARSLRDRAAHWGARGRHRKRISGM